MRGKIAGCWLVLSALGWLIASGEARADECTTSICSGDPCTITGNHQLTASCTLDFGTKTVTLASLASLESPDGGSVNILAGDLTVRGLIQADDGNIAITTTGDFKLLGTGTSGRILSGGTFGAIDINAGAAATI